MSNSVDCAVFGAMTSVLVAMIPVSHFLFPLMASAVVIPVGAIALGCGAIVGVACFGGALGYGLHRLLSVPQNQEIQNQIPMPSDKIKTVYDKIDNIINSQENKEQKESGIMQALFSLFEQGGNERIANDNEYNALQSMQSNDQFPNEKILELIKLYTIAY